MTTIRIADGAAFSLYRAQRARLRHRRNPTKNSVQSRRISVSGNGTAHPGKEMGIIDPSCAGKRELAIRRDCRGPFALVAPMAFRRSDAASSHERCPHAVLFLKTPIAVLTSFSRT